MENKSWPKKTKLITPFIGFTFESYDILFEVKPEYVIDVTIVIDIPPVDAFNKNMIEEIDKNNKIVKLKFNLITPEDIILGDDLVVSLHYNDNIFDELNKEDKYVKEKYLYSTHLSSI